jgi:SHS2 domain-containing protein
MSYKFIDHTADIAAELTGNSYEEIFESAAYAWKQTALETGQRLTDSEKYIELSSTLPEILLVDFLNELNYLLLIKKWITYSIDEISISSANSLWNLQAKIKGTDYSPQIHTLKIEIKAITFHQMQIENVNGKFSTRIIFDI